MTNYTVSLVGRGRRMVVVLSDIVGESPSVCGEPLSMRSIYKYTHTHKPHTLYIILLLIHNLYYILYSCNKNHNLNGIKKISCTTSSLYQSHKNVFY